MVIPINLVRQEEEIATIYLYMSGKYGDMSTTISFDKKKSNGYDVDLYTSYDQLFESSQNTTLMACYLDKEKKNVYNFSSLDTMRYQGYYLEITMIFLIHCIVNFMRIINKKVLVIFFLFGIILVRKFTL